MKGCHWLVCVLWGLVIAVVPAQDNQIILLEFQDAPVMMILQALADYRQLNLITAAGVDGNLTLQLDNGHWPQELVLVLRIGKLSMTRDGSVMIVSAELDAQEKQQHQQALALQHRLHSVTLALKNADAAVIAEILNAQRGALLGERGIVVADKRTNVLLIRDTFLVLAPLKKRVAEMDIPLAQVQLAARRYNWRHIS